MKQDIHPEYRPVVFLDSSAEFSILTKSTVETKETIEWEDGNTYPLYKVEISSASHPFYTGTMKIIDSAGRVERFEKRYGTRRRKAAATEEPKGEAPKAEKAPAKEEPKAEAPKAEEAPAQEAPAAEESAPETTEES